MPAQLVVNSREAVAYFPQKTTLPGGDMRYEHRSIWVGVAALAATAMSVTAVADPDLEKRMADPNQWASQAGDFANHRWSDLFLFFVGFVGLLLVVWSLSSGVLRGLVG